jgi:putative oxidoreductase
MLSRALSPPPPATAVTCSARYSQLLRNFEEDLQFSLLTIPLRLANILSIDSNPRNYAGLHQKTKSPPFGFSGVRNEKIRRCWCTGSAHSDANSVYHRRLGQNHRLCGYPTVYGSHGRTGCLLPLTILLEFGGGLAILFGFLTRTTALFTAGFTLLTAFLFHSNFAEGVNSLMFMKNLTIAGGFLLLAITGPGAFSIDRVLNKKW